MHKQNEKDKHAAENVLTWQTAIKIQLTKHKCVHCAPIEKKFLQRDIQGPSPFSIYLPPPPPNDGPNNAHHWNIEIPGLEVILGLTMPTSGIERFQDWR